MRAVQHALQRTGLRPAAERDNVGWTKLCLRATLASWEKESMGNTMEFFAGDPDRIGKAIDDGAYDTLDTAPWVLGRADFSMHLLLEHLDVLTTTAAALVSASPLKFSTEIQRCVAGDRSKAWDWRESSADTLSSRWRDLIASVPESRAEEFARAWFRAIPLDYEPESAVDDAIKDLIRLCAAAKEKDLALVFDFSA